MHREVVDRGVSDSIIRLHGRTVSSLDDEDMSVACVRFFSPLAGRPPLKKILPILSACGAHQDDRGLRGLLRLIRMHIHVCMYTYADVHSYKKLLTRANPSPPVFVGFSSSFPTGQRRGENGTGRRRIVCTAVDISPFADHAKICGLLYQCLFLASFLHFPCLMILSTPRSVFPSYW